jgi:hypothetical protein
MWRTLCVLVLFSLGLAACAPAAAPTAAPLPPTELKYKLIDRFGAPFFCDPDLWPVPREPELDAAQRWFAGADTAGEEFAALRVHLRLGDATSFSPEQQLLIYQEHKKLLAITLSPDKGGYTFNLRTGVLGAQGEAVQGTINVQGEIGITSQTGVMNDCPRCLAAGTRIDTPAGPVAVEELKPGMAVWTVDAGGARVAGVLVAVVRVPVPPGHQVVRVQLADGRVLLVSPGHPLPGGRVAGDLRAGDALGGVRVLRAARVPYAGAFTYDVLPSGATGYYWAEGVLLASTLHK